jgi:cystathionine beta-synthase
MTIHQSVLELIGRHADRARPAASTLARVQLYFKLESQNPGGSIKDRIGCR